MSGPTYSLNNVTYRLSLEDIRKEVNQSL
jgi:hypothetical protein